MFQTTIAQFEAAIIVRSFLVGFRYYRQSHATRAQMLHTMVNMVQGTMLDQPVAYSQLNVKNVFKTLVSSLSSLSDGEEQAAKILLLASPAIMSKEEVCRAAGIELSENTKAEIEDAIIQHIENNEALQQDMLLAYTGNKRFASALNIEPMDEDVLADADYIVPTFPENPADWKQTLTAHREAQWLSYRTPEELADTEVGIATDNLPDMLYNEDSPDA